MATINRRTIFAVAGLAFCAAVAWSVKGYLFVAEPAPQNLSGNRVALAGYDPVAYFTLNTPTEGDASISHDHAGAVYRFASAEHKDMFVADPEKYTPAYGGYCSYGVRMGMKFDIDPTAYEIVDDKLYVQLDPGTRSVWLQEPNENIRIADDIWKDIRQVPPSSLPLSEPG